MPQSAIMVPRLYRPGTSKPWRVLQGATISPTGKKRQRWFRSKELASAWIRDEEKRLRSYRDHARELSDEEKLAAAEAIPIAREHGFTLLDAVREKAARVVQQRASRPISAVTAEFVAQLTLEKKSPSHLTAAKYIGKKFAAEFADCLLSDVTTEGLQKWFNAVALTDKPASVKTYRRYVSMIVRFGLVKKYLVANPLDALRLRLRDDAAISYLTPEKTRALIAAADPLMRPYFALCAYAGLRPGEAEKLRWANVGETIYIEPASSKTRQHRHVPILRILAPFLTSEARVGEQVHYSRKLFRQAIKAIGYGARREGLAKWPQDCLRHGFGSYWLALYDDEARLAAIMGNSPKVIFTHYRVPMKKTDAEAYFQPTATP